MKGERRPWSSLLVFAKTGRMPRNWSKKNRNRTTPPPSTENLWRFKTSTFAPRFFSRQHRMKQNTLLAKLNFRALVPLIFCNIYQLPELFNNWDRKEHKLWATNTHPKPTLSTDKAHLLYSSTGLLTTKPGCFANVVGATVSLLEWYPWNNAPPEVQNTTAIIAQGTAVFYATSFQCCVLMM